jgi:hypothetical protein
MAKAPERNPGPKEAAMRAQREAKAKSIKAKSVGKVAKAKAKTRGR